MSTTRFLRSAWLAALLLAAFASAAFGQRPYDDRYAPEQGGDVYFRPGEMEVSAPFQAADPAMPSLEERLAAMERELQQMREAAEADAKRRADATKGDEAKGDSKDAPKTDAKKTDGAKKDGDKKDGDKKADGEWEDISAEKWTVKLGGHVQMDYINWVDTNNAAIPAQNYFEFRRLRLVADGTGFGVYDFRLQMTLEPESIGESAPGIATSPDVKDAYLSMNEVPLFHRLRVGNFFVPFSLEQVTNDTNNIFLERSIPTQGIFAADREVGTAFYGVTPDLNATLSGGVFFDSISDTLKERIDDNQGIRLAGRATWLPYYDEPSNGRYLMHLGAGVLYTDDHDDIARFRARPQVKEGPRLIDSLPLAADTYTTGNLELAVVNGRFTVQSEAFLCQVNLNNADPELIGGAYVHGSWFLTGENRIYERYGQHGAQFGRNVPFTNFFLIPGGVGWGAWELKARWSNLDLNSLNRGQYNDFTFGFNWYWTERIRIMFDWIHPMTTPPARPFGASDSDLIGMRFDFNW